MAAGYDLQNGKYDPTLKSSKEIREILTFFLENSANKSSSYKYVMFKSIMDCLHMPMDKTYRISFDMLYSRFAEIYWVLVFKHKIPQKAFSIRAPETLAEKVILKIAEKHKIRRKTQYADLDDSIRKELVRQMKTNCSRYVFGALYAETERILYSFSKDKEWIKVNPQIVYFLEKHGNAIQKINYQAWANYYIEIEAENGKDVGYYQRLLKREFGDNTVLPIKENTAGKRASSKKAKPGRTKDEIIANKLRVMLSRYPDLGLYLNQICEKLNLEKDKAKTILESSYWCKKEGSRYYYVNISDSDLIEDALFLEEIVEDDEDVRQESDTVVDSESLMLLSDPEELIKKLKREKGIIKATEQEPVQSRGRGKTIDNNKKNRRRSSKGSKSVI